jgi:hypothetical protein
MRDEAVVFTAASADASRAMQQSCADRCAAASRQTECLTQLAAVAGGVLPRGSSRASTNDASPEETASGGHEKSVGCIAGDPFGDHTKSTAELDHSFVIATSVGLFEPHE